MSSNSVDSDRVLVNFKEKVRVDLMFKILHYRYSVDFLLRIARCIFKINDESDI